MAAERRQTMLLQILQPAARERCRPRFDHRAPRQHASSKHFSFPLDCVTFACSVKDSFGKAREERNGGEFVPANGTEGTIDREGEHLRGLP